MLPAAQGEGAPCRGTAVAGPERAAVVLGQRCHEDQAAARLGLLIGGPWCDAGRHAVADSDVQEAFPHGQL
ncbi:hypothetical protein GCM10010350_73000 [Streptomyces galilaeus]|nr:hypothetical protein GCM10010350_73000 [Streptomyces galilaeus]